MPPLLAGKTIAEVGDSFSGDLLGDDPVGSWDCAAKECTDAVRECASDGTVHVSYGDITAEALDPESVDLLYAKFKPQEKQLKDSGVFGSMVVPPPGASRQTELLAVFGRVA